MDEDIYFSDKKKSNKKKTDISDRISADPKVERDFISEVRSGNPVKNKPVSKNKGFDDTDFEDESFQLNFKKKAPVIEIPEYDPYGKKEAERRAPAGKPLKDMGDNRTPKGTKVSERVTPVAQSRTPQGKKKKKKSPKVKVTLALICLAFILISALGVYAFTALSGINYEKREKNEYISSTELATSESVRNILVIGCDARGDVEGNRSDTMILFSIDEKNKKIKLTSFLRDSYLYIPEKGYSNKVNAAFNYGGHDMLIDTLEYNFKIKIDNYVMVDFKAFRQLIDLLGGITVDGVTEKEAKYMRDEVDLTWVKAGKNKMNGRTALWYCRIRYIDNDFKRTERQRKVISAVISKATRTDIFTLMDICKKVLPNITTDIERTELMALAVNAALRYLRYDIVQQQMPADGEWADRWVGNQQVVALDLEANRKILKEFLYQ